MILLGTLLAGLSAVGYLIWVGGKLRKSKDLEEGMKKVGKVNEMVYKVDKETEDRIAGNSDSNVSRGFPRLPRDK
tara:strand:- start:14299 stop:14523 length:225 start_codon:yes stop_codon:yes gene_type:complete